VDPSSLGAVLATAAGGVLAYWALYFLLVLQPDERVFVRGLLRRRRKSSG
jgi:hypothetical protein